LNGAERGSAVLETVASISMVLLLALGAIEVAFALYARNVLAASAHEGARAAIELGRSPEDAVAVAGATVRRAAGGLVSDLDISVATGAVNGRSVVRVHVTGSLKPFGPVPLPMRFSNTATSTRQTGL